MLYPARDYTSLTSPFYLKAFELEGSEIKARESLRFSGFFIFGLSLIGNSKSNKREAGTVFLPPASHLLFV